MSRAPTSRRRFLQLVAGTGVASRTLTAADLSRTSDTAAGMGTAGAAADPSQGTRATAAAIGDGPLRLEFDSALRSRAWQVRREGRGPGIALTPWGVTEYLLLTDGSRIELFALRHTEHESVNGPHGRGARLTLSGVGSQSPGPRGSAAQIEKNVRIELYERYPGFAFYRVSYRNLSPQPIALRAWRSADLHLLAAGSNAAAAAGDGRPAPAAPVEPQFWCYCGSTHEDRRDWVQPVRVGFSQENFMGMTASDYGGGIPIVDVWRRDCGLAVGHVDPVPRLLSLPLARTERGVQLGIAGTIERPLATGEVFSTPETFIATHTGDYFSTLDTYRRIMSERGLASPRPPDSAYEAIWCAWGYERRCTPQLIDGTLPKVRDLGLRWAVIDDGWQTNVGDWKPDPAKFPRGSADLKRLVRDIRAHSLKPRLWVAPLACAPGSDLLHDHTDMLLLDKEGAPQNISWWNSFYLCPAYGKTVAYTQSLVRRFIGEWGFAGLKIDGQHLNGVAPCYNPAHRHARPEESLERLQDFVHAMYVTALKLDPEAVMELCPCGTGYSLYNLASVNQAPASDPESSWQVRHKGKTLKALMGPSAAFAGDHVELSDGGDDFASTVGIGAIVSTKFTWPRDPKPKDSFLLTPQREALWRKWIALYNERVLPQGSYRGELYDIGFDRPETHVVEKSGRLYYAFYGRSWNGPVTLRGLAAARYRVRDYFNDRDLGEVAAPGGALELAFERFLLLEAIPV
ncbi:MAG TPA: glycoside hydrolase family 36 protein [Steroidobacteraceae bacterium]|nr:glycoside hydrolase family 36 protein [Steroidobacteraceae bacterium]